MSIDQSKLQRLAEMLAGVIEEAVAPLRVEISTLRRQVDEMRGRAAPAQGTMPRIEPPSPGTRTAAAVAPAPRRLARGPVEKSDCEVPGCHAPVLAKRLCETHYRIMRRVVAAGGEFDPARQRPAGTRPALRSCQEPGCGEPHYAKDLCRRHYMAERARVRSAPHRLASKSPVARLETAAIQPARLAPVAADPARSPVPEPRPAAEEARAAEPATAVVAEPDGQAQVTWVYADAPGSSFAAMPTAEVVARVVAQYRGGLGKVAEVLGRNRRDLMDLLEKLNIMEHVVGVRASERKRILSAPLQERLSDLLFREKLLEDLGCLKEVDEAARRDVQARCAQFAKICETQEDALQKLGAECGLEEAGLKRLVWRYDLRRQLRDLKSKSPTMARTRP